MKVVQTLKSLLFSQWNLMRAKLPFLVGYLATTDLSALSCIWLH